MADNAPDEPVGIRRIQRECQPAWNPNLRSKTAIRTSDTRYFVDPSIAATSMGIGPDDLLGDMNTFGLLFETLAVRDLRIYADALDGQVYHYRDKTGLECDAVIHLRNGSYGLVEIKLGGDTLTDAGAASLLKLAAKIDTDKMTCYHHPQHITSNTHGSIQLHPVLVKAGHELVPAVLQGNAGCQVAVDG